MSSEVHYHQSGVSMFFEEIYANYNRVWQEIIKIPIINGEYVSFEVINHNNNSL